MTLTVVSLRERLIKPDLRALYGALKAPIRWGHPERPLASVHLCTSIREGLNLWLLCNLNLLCALDSIHSALWLTLCNCWLFLEFAFAPCVSHCFYCVFHLCAAANQPLVLLRLRISVCRLCSCVLTSCYCWGICEQVCVFSPKSLLLLRIFLRNCRHRERMFIIAYKFWFVNLFFTTFL